MRSVDAHPEKYAEIRARTAIQCDTDVRKGNCPGFAPPVTRWISATKLIGLDWNGKTKSATRLQRHPLIDPIFPHPGPLPKGEGGVRLAPYSHGGTSTS